jgi:hypothetical protein
MMGLFEELKERNPSPIVGYYFMPENGIQLTLVLSVVVFGYIWIEFQKSQSIDSERQKNEAGSYLIYPQVF